MWNKLYNHLETDGLLPTEGYSPAIRPVVRINTISIITIISLCIYPPITSRTDSQSSIGELLVKANKEENILITTLEDGSVVYLSRQTSLQYPKHFSERRREVSLKGNALFDTAGSRTRPFFVETGKIQIEMIGTAFHVKNSGNSPFELSVQRGEIKVTQKQNGQEIHVKAGGAAISLQSEWHPTATKDFKQFIRYMQEICFKGERLDNILYTINLRQSEVHLKSSPELDEHLLTVPFSNDSPEKMAELASMALNLKCTRKHNVITFTKQLRNLKEKKK